MRQQSCPRDDVCGPHVLCMTEEWKFIAVENFPQVGLLNVVKNRMTDETGDDAYADLRHAISDLKPKNQ